MSQHVKNGLTYQLSAASVSVERYKLAVCMYRQKYIKIRRNIHSQILMLKFYECI